MEILDDLNQLLVSCGMKPGVADVLDQLVAFLAVILVALLADTICRKILLRVVDRLVRKTKAAWDDIVFQPAVMTRLSRIVAPIIIYIFIPVAFAHSSSFLLSLIQRVCLLYVIVCVLLFCNSFLKAIYHVYSDMSTYRDRPLKGLLQTAQIIVWFIGGIVLVAVLVDRSPITLLAGLGASAAVLMLIFKDSIVGLVSGIQLSVNDMLKVGDWIALPSCGVDGSVIEVSLVTVKVRNWDNTIITIPPYTLLSGSFQNWRGMHESGGRRIKRSINIDMNTVQFCSLDELDRFRRFDLIRDYVDQTEQALRQRDASRQTVTSAQESNVEGPATPAGPATLPINLSRQTNLGLLRAYLIAYLKSLPEVNTDLTCTVRQLQPTEHGLPLELYFFSRIKDWMPYEKLQADIFDHVLAIIPEFGLRVYQLPAGTDVQGLASQG